jgi:hypothetical protein
MAFVHEDARKTHEKKRYPWFISQVLTNTKLSGRLTLICNAINVQNTVLGIRIFFINSQALIGPHMFAITLNPLPNNLNIASIITSCCSFRSLDERRRRFALAVRERRRRFEQSLLFATLSDRIGRKAVFIGSLVVMGVLVFPWLLLYGTGSFGWGLGATGC